MDKVVLRVTINKAPRAPPSTNWGERIEYVWSDFKRVRPHPDNVIVERFKR